MEQGTLRYLSIEVQTNYLRNMAFQANIYFIHGSERDLLVDCGVGIFSLWDYLHSTLGLRKGNEA